MQQRKPWEISEQELLEKEYAYIKKFNWFERIIDDHLYYVLLMIFSTPAWFILGLGIGALIAR